MRYLLFIVVIISCKPTLVDSNCDLVDKYKADSTYTYAELMEAYRCLESKSDHLLISNAGISDCGEEIASIVLSSDPIRGKSIEEITRGKYVIFVNNGIHPGESCGVDASLKLVKEINQDYSQLKDVVLVIVPLYNIGGAMDRRRVTRMNQDGPIGQGFRGNAQNLDLNRDLIKRESRNTEALHRLLTIWKPLLFIDTHSTNGADYQYSMTFIESPYSKYPKKMGDLIKGLLHDEIYQYASQSGVKMSPYVNVFGRSPEPGFDIFHETPIYTTGYTSARGIYSYVTEAHMLKPYIDRVEATYVVLKGFIDIANRHGKLLSEAKEESYAQVPDYLNFTWQVDTSKCNEFVFEGYEEEFEKSKIGNWTRRMYNRNRPFSRKIKYCGVLAPLDSGKVPQAYIVERGWSWMKEYFENQGIFVQELEAGEKLNVQGQKIIDFKSLSSPYERHFVHREVEVAYPKLSYATKKGDLLIQVTPENARILWETLEAQCEGSLMRWNVFDAVLQAKEGFSDYVFEDTAMALLNRLPDLKAQWDSTVMENPDILNHQGESLQWIYQHSNYFEPRYRLLPVYRIY